jgi:hypothetical protein
MSTPSKSGANVLKRSLRGDSPVSKTEKDLARSAKKALSGENFEEDSMGYAAKPISLRPLKFDAAVAALLKVKPEPKAQK